MGKSRVTLEGNLMILAFEGDITIEDMKPAVEEIRRILKNHPPNLRAVYDGRKLGKSGMPEAMFFRPIITDEISPKVIKGAGVAANATIGFLGKIAFALSANHKMFYAEDYDKAMEWVKS